MQVKILLLCQKSNWCSLANDFINANFDDVLSIFWDKGDAYPSEINQWQGDWILSFRGDLILSSNIINSASKHAINFHPSTPKYRGIGSHHYAIYNQDEYFGVTCHHISSEIDKGEIIKVNRFKIGKHETSSSLGLRVGAYCLVMFYDFVINHLLHNNKIIADRDEKWSELLYTHHSFKTWSGSIKHHHPNHRCLL